MNESLIGTTMQVLVEGAGRGPNSAIGRTYGDAPEIDGRIFLRGRDLQVGSFYDARITAADGYDLEGTVEANGAQRR